MIKLISSKAAYFLCKEDNEETLELYEYAIYIVLSAIFHTTTVILLGLFFNQLVESIAFYCSFIVIRKFAGGYHAKTPIRCYLFYIISSIIMLLIIKMFNSVNVIFTHILIIFELLCVLIVLLTSPLDTENNPLNRNEKKLYKILSASNSLCISIVSILCVLTGYRNIGCSITCGVIMSALVLLMRKIQIINMRIKK